MAAAYELALWWESQRIVLVDPLPLTLTSDKLTECYRNWWPGPGRNCRFMATASISKEMAAVSGDRFANGIAMATPTSPPSRSAPRPAGDISTLGAGDRGEMSDPLFPEAPYDKLDPIHRRRRPPGSIRRRSAAATRSSTRRPSRRSCRGAAAGSRRSRHGPLEQARDAGVQLVEGRLTSVAVESGGVSGVEIARRGGSVERIATGALVSAAGPLAQAGRMCGLKLPLFNELHGKVYLDDVEQVVPRELLVDDPGADR